MSERDEEDLDPRLREHLIRDYGDDRPAPELEERVADELRRHGLLPGPSAGRRWRLPVGAVAAAILLFVAGVWTGRGTAPGLSPTPAVGPSSEPSTAAPAAEASTYLLLLLEPAGEPIADAEGTPEASLVREYAAWARELAAEERLLLGEKLGDEARRLSRDDAAPGGPVPHGTTGGRDEALRVTGFFLLRAPTMEEATALARSCPHLRHGGTIEVRPIEPT